MAAVAREGLDARKTEGSLLFKNVSRQALQESRIGEPQIRKSKIELINEAKLVQRVLRLPARFPAALQVAFSSMVAMLHYGIVTPLYLSSIMIPAHLYRPSIMINYSIHRIQV